jgi:hypothetical protein
MSNDSCEIQQKMREDLFLRKEKYLQKGEVVENLFKKIYANKIIKVEGHSNGGIWCVFSNKPQQDVLLQFIMFDTWDKIKNKVNKLIESDGICAVCYEMEKPEKGKCVGICNSCCEYVCKDCVRKMDGVRCPVCRVCVVQYRHDYFQEECDCLYDDDDDDDDDE